MLIRNHYTIIVEIKQLIRIQYIITKIDNGSKEIQIIEIDDR